ncbi:MAG: aminotransferase class V-fold PLP-dependent enzyme [Syntrophales bacterium]|jgi:cysteine desulfurase family protein|nr:aminotransferase class V-fold PLP-dependent enzyme [Syntrophales bacterium]
MMQPDSGENRLIYFDNAATTWPKPPEMIAAMGHYNEMAGGSPGRSGHRRSLAAGRIILEAREALAELFGIGDSLRIAFTKNATEALNIALLGLLHPGDHVITSSMEHNSVMRPLRFLETQGVSLSVVSCSGEGRLNPEDVRTAIRPQTRLLVVTHASNVTGTILPLAELGQISREQGLLFCVDAAQTAGALPIHVDEMAIDLLAFSGHKSLFGPQGTGGLYIREGIEKQLQPLMMGGTGSRSEFEAQPDFLPDKYESGTPNTIGIAGLGAGVRFVLAAGVEAIRRKEEGLTDKFLKGFASLQGIALYGPPDAASRTAVVSFNIAGVSPSEAALMFEERFGILCRPGLQCAPAAHRTIGTFSGGTIRFGFGYFNTDEEISFALEAIRCLAAET